MRIRKNVKLSSVMPPEMLRTHECQLNQSPWDVISFSQETDTSSFHQFFGEDPVPEDERFTDKFGDVNGSSTSLTEREETAVPNVEEDCNIIERQIFSCRKSNGRGSQGKNEPKQETMREMATAGRRGRPRAAKNGSTSMSNQYEFYYYSGFGPYWGKKRGAKGSEGNKVVKSCTRSNKPSFSENDNGELVCIEDEVGKDGKNGDSDKIEDEFGEDNKNMFSYKKRKRKLVKARSLQSLI